MLCDVGIVSALSQCQQVHGSKTDMRSVMQMSEQKETPFVVALLAGGCAGTAVDVALFPIDTIKTRLQASDCLLPPPRPPPRPSSTPSSTPSSPDPHPFVPLPLPQPLPYLVAVA
eukprot:746520-Hanusia_phi.AAC.1